VKVSVITPTWQRYELLRERCIPSVAAQTYLDLEHIVCSDGPDRVLRDLLADEPVTYVETKHHDVHPANFGSRARNRAIEASVGDLIAYLDDDNAWRPEHLTLLVKALQDESTDFAYSKLVTHPQGVVIGTDPPRYGGIDTSAIVHRRELLDKGRWPKPGQIDGDKHAPDWAIVDTWLRAGATWVHVPAITVDYHYAGS
jgi:glycosyltransferase involved in cell wall biosynthesis